jgi:hypothetical protein
MATAGKGKKLPIKARVSDSDFYIPPLPVAVAVLFVSQWRKT